MKQIFFIFQVFTLLFSADQLIHIKNITSLINTTDIEIINQSNILVSSIGGVYDYNFNNSNSTNRSFIDYTKNLKYVHINSIATNNDKIWLLSNYPYGNIQILNENYKLLHTIDWIDEYTEMKKIVFSDDYAFVIASKNNTDILLQYSLYESESYLNEYNDLSITINSVATNITTINDINVIDEVLYVSTDIGMLNTDLKEKNIDLILGSDWTQSNENENIIILLDTSEYATFNTEFCFKNICSNVINQIEKIIDYENNYYILSSQHLYQLDENSNSFIPLITMPSDISSNFNDFEIFNNKIYFSLENHGVLVAKLSNFEIIDNFIPNSIFKNDFVAIDVYDNKKISAISKDGGFVIDDVFSNSLDIKNFYSFTENYIELKYPEQTDMYYGKVLTYIIGEKESPDIKFNHSGKQISFINSNLYLNQNDQHFSGYNYLINNGAEYIAGLISLNVSSLEITESWGEDIFTGMNCLTSSGQNCDKNYTVLNQMQYDNDDNLWVINSHSEGNVNKPLCIYNDEKNTWSYIEDDIIDEAYLLTEISFDYDDNVWVAYQEQSYSPGGIRLIEHKDDNYSWYYGNPLSTTSSYCNSMEMRLSGVNVWSIDIGKDQYDNTILWTLSDFGVMGYIINYNYSSGLNNLSIDAVPINCEFYFSDVSFNATSKIRVDKQNNAWISSNDGIRVIKSNGQIWPDNFTINQESTKLLSDNVYDIEFDGNGHVYIATKQGISIFKTVFSANKSISNISVSPNPFKIGKDKGITITNFPSNTTIQILTLKGKVLKEFKLTEQSSILNWDGRDKYGNYLNTGIYLIAGFSKEKKTGVTKLAIIRN